MSSPLTSQPELSSTILSLPDDLLLKIFHYLPTPLPGDVDFPSRSFTSGCTSPASALANTCRRLEKLRRTRVVNCVDLSRAFCGFRLPVLLHKYPAVDRAVLGALCATHGQKIFHSSNSGTLGRLLALRMSVVPSTHFAKTFCAAVPQLRDLQVGPMIDDDMASWPSSAAQNQGMAQLFRQLPSGLWRLRITLTFDPSQNLTSPSSEQAQSGLWVSIGKMNELKELRIVDAFSIPKRAVFELQKCHQLRVLDVFCRKLDAWGTALNEFLEALPSSLVQMNIHTLHCQQPPLLRAGCLERLTQLERLFANGWNILDWAILKPVAPQMRKLCLENTN